MPRHGKNSTYSPVFTYHERQKASKASGWGSQSTRLNKDALKEFDCCSLTLQPCMDPVITLDGHLYEREKILEYILHHKQENAKKLKAYEKQLKKEEKETVEELNKDQKEKVEKFLGLERSITTKRDSPFLSSDLAPASKKKKEEGDGNIENTNETEKSKLPSFWIPGLTPQAEKSRLEKPDLTVYCPMSGNPIRMKDLVSLKFKLSPEEEGKSLIAKKERYICAVSHDTLNNSVPCAVLKPTGDVVTLDYVEKFIKKDWTCPITGKKLRKKDIIELKRGGTGFAAAADGKLEAKQYGAALTC